MKIINADSDPYILDGFKHYASEIELNWGFIRTHPHLDNIEGVDILIHFLIGHESKSHDLFSEAN